MNDKKDNMIKFLYNLAKKDQQLLIAVNDVIVNKYNKDVWIRLGEHLLKKGYYKQCIECLKKSIENNNQPKSQTFFLRGQAYLKLGNYHDALLDFDKCIQIGHSKTAETMFLKAKALTYLEKYDDAINCINKAMQEGFKNAELFSIRGVILYNLKNYSEALKSFNDSLNLDKNNYKAWVNQGIILTRIGKFIDAEKSYLQALELEPNNIVVTKNLCYLYSDSLNIYDKALDLCRLLNRIEPNNENITYLVETMIKVKKYDEAITYSLQLLEASDTELIYIILNKFFVICAYLLSGRIEKGVTMTQNFLNYYDNKHKPRIIIDEHQWVFKGLKNAIAKEKNNLLNNILFNLIDLIQDSTNEDKIKKNLKDDLQKLEKSAKDIEEQPTKILQELEDLIIDVSRQKLKEFGYTSKYIGFDEKIPNELYSDIEQLYEKLERIKHISKSLQSESYYVNNDNMALADLMGIGGQYEKALKIYDNILEKDQDNQKALMNKAFCLYKLGDYTESKRFFDKVLLSDKDNVNALVMNGLIMSKFGYKIEENKYYFEAINKKILPGDFDGFLYKGIALHQVGQYLDALDHLDRALELNPKSDRALVNKGIVFDKIKRFDEAMTCYNKALDLNPNSISALYNKACSLALQGKDENSLDYLERAIKIMPQYKYIAKKDTDFQSIQNKKRFESITLIT